MNRITTRKRRGFTLIELLVVVLILSILMAVALPLYLSAVSDSQRKVCRANMQTIANAVQASRVRTNAANYGALITGGVTVANLPDLNAVPQCPERPERTPLANGNTADNTYVQSLLQLCNWHGTRHVPAGRRQQLDLST